MVLTMGVRHIAFQGVMALCLLVSSLSPAAPAGPIDFDGQPADRIVVTWSATMPDVGGLIEADLPMVNRIKGVAYVADAADRRLWSTLSHKAKPIGWPSELRVLGYLHASRGEQVKTSAIGVTPDNIMILKSTTQGENQHAGQHTASTMPIRGVGFDASAFGAMIDALDEFHGPFDTMPTEPLGEVVSLDVDPTTNPTQSRNLLDAQGIADRLYDGSPTGQPFEPTDRLVTEESFFVRLPTSYRPTSPAGLMVWVGPDNEGIPPEQMYAVADEDTLLIVSFADGGNLRLASNRLQLALDAVARVRGQYFIDPSRIYVVGFSGGGKIASTLAACFPDVFAGCISISAAVTFEPIPLGDGRFIGRGFLRPTGKRWKQLREHPIALVTGQLDYNHISALNAADVMRREGLKVRLFDFKDLGHDMPSADRFATILRWVDSPALQARNRRWKMAQQTLDRYLARVGENAPATQPQKRMLERIIRQGPWSPAAWQACGQLGIASGT